MKAPIGYAWRNETGVYRGTFGWGEAVVNEKGKGVEKVNESAAIDGFDTRDTIIRFVCTNIVASGPM